MGSGRTLENTTPAAHPGGTRTILGTTIDLGASVDMNERVHALDAVRAFALLLGVVFHTSMSFVPGIANMGWPIVDRSPSDVLGVFFFVTHTFRMTLFFVVCGYFAHLLFHRGGPKVFWVNRTKRVLAPLLVFWPIVLASIMAAMHWASLKYGHFLPVPRPSVQIHFPLTHLWFLYLLFGLYAWLLAARFCLIALCGPVNRLRLIVDAAVERVCSVPLAPALLAIPVALALYLQPVWHPWDGIPTPDNSLVPNTPAFVAFAVAFTFGWLLRRQSQALERFKRHIWVNLFVAVCLTATCLMMAGLTMDNAELSGWHRARFVIFYGAAGWFWTFAVVGAAQRFWSHPNAWRRYLADASYWIYLVHLPLVFGLQVAVSDWSLSWALKFPLVLAVAMLLLLASYQRFVRASRLGLWLNGRQFVSSVIPPS